MKNVTVRCFMLWLAFICTTIMFCQDDACCLFSTSPKHSRHDAWAGVEIMSPHIEAQRNDLPIQIPQQKP